MRHFYKYLPIALLLFPAFCVAQKNFKDGYILKFDGDTLRGYIDYREWDSNPTEIRFKKNVDAPEQTFSTINAKGFGINGMEFYQQFTVLMSMNKIGINDAIFNKDTASVLKAVFLKQLISSSKISLYEYADDIKTRYYYQEKGGTPRELVYSLYDDDTGEIHFNRRYRAQLTYLALKYNPENAAVKKDIEKTDYNENDLFNVIAGIINKNQIVYKGNSMSTFMVGGGLSYGMLNFDDTGLAQPNTTDNHLPMPFLSIGFINYVNKTTRKFFFTVEASAITDLHKLHNERKTSNGNSTIITAYSDLKFTQYIVRLNPNIGYNFYSTPKLKIFAMLGFSLNFAWYSKHNYIETYDISSTPYILYNYPGFAKAFIRTNIRAGITLGQQFDIYADYSKGSINYVDLKLPQVGFYYHLQ